MFAYIYVSFHAGLFILELGAKFAENGLWGGESLTREFEQNGFNLSLRHMLINDPRLPNPASFIGTLTIHNT